MWTLLRCCKGLLRFCQEPPLKEEWNVDVISHLVVLDHAQNFLRTINVMPAKLATSLRLVENSDIIVLWILYDFFNFLVDNLKLFWIFLPYFLEYRI